MKHTRRHFLLFALLFAACLTSSQAMAAELASDGNDAKTELNKAIKAVKRLGAFEARWEASEFQGSAQTASFSGNIYVSSPRVYLSTSQQSIWYDGHTEWNLRTGASEVYVSTPTAAEAAKINPLSFLSIPLSNYNAQPLKRTTLRGESTISSGGGYTITTTATQSTLTTTAAGTYSAIATSSCVAKRTNSITIANLDMSEQKTVRKVSQWYVKNGRPTPDIALWQLGEGETFKSVEWSPANATGLDFRTDTETGIVYLEGKEPSANTSGDIEYTLTLTITDACGTDHALSGQTIKLTHQKNTDKHVLAFVVGNTEKNNNKYVAIGKGFTESITASQTTQVSLYNAIAAQFDVQATNIYSTDDEQKLREYYSQYDILCITDYPNTRCAH